MKQGCPREHPPTKTSLRELEVAAAAASSFCGRLVFQETAAKSFERID